MKTFLLLIFAVLTMASTSMAAWFKVQAKDFSRIEMMGNKQIVLYRPLDQYGNSLPGISLSSFYPTGSQGEAGTVDQFTFTPPAGIESQFLSILLSALATKGTLVIEGHLPTNSTQISSTRVQIQ